MDRESIREAMGRFVAEHPHNRISEEQALCPEDVGQRMYEAPIIAVGDAADPLWAGLKQPQAVGPLFRTPEEWLPGARSVISYFAPFTDFVRRGNAADPVRVGNGWLYARVDGQQFLHELNHFLEDLLADAGYGALSPYASPDFRQVFAAGSNPQIEDKTLSLTSNWSERHAAYVCGLGTFGLSKGLITRRGVSGRFGSVITTLPLPADRRPYHGLYDYCIMCGVCARNCPAHAISLEEGKRHAPCSEYVSESSRAYAPRFGCGKCQVNVPCETRIPNPEYREDRR